MTRFYFIYYYIFVISPFLHLDTSLKLPEMFRSRSEISGGVACGVGVSAESGIGLRNQGFRHIRGFGGAGHVQDLR